MRQPRLVVVYGRERGRELDLDPGRERAPFLIGRHSSSDLHLVEHEVSRRHAEIRRDGDRCELLDLDSRHGTFVNSLPIGSRALQHGDLVRIGRTVLLFLLHPSSSEEVSRATASLATANSEETNPNRPDDTSDRSLYLRGGDLRAALDRSARRRVVAIAGDLQALLEISAAAAAARDEEELARRPLALLREALGASRGRFLADAVEEDDTAAGCVRQDAEHRLVATLEARGHPLGGLVFEREEPFRAEAGDLLQAAASILSLALDNLRFMAALQAENRRRGGVPGLFGESVAVRRVDDLLARVAPVDSTVLLRGESGTGKELAARTIHQRSPRADGPMIAVNCATLSETLLESELFGHERGAFTGAVERKIGKIEAAAGGTLFLDEVGEIPPPLQAKLLRVLQEREFERVGGVRPVRADVRVIAATHRDLEAAIRDGTFREDLFYRLNVITVVLPPLREREGDVILLARHFTSAHGRRLRRREIGLAPEARRLIAAYDWPGNVRQLANAIERAVVLGDGEMVRAEDLPEEILDHVGASGAASPDASAVSDFQAAIIETKKKLLTEALAAAGGNAAEAARRLGLHPNSFRRLLRQLGLP